MTPEQIKHMVGRFLGWKLPANFSPDAGISFKADYNEHTPWPAKHEPSGTNLFDATQAQAMVQYMIDGMPDLDRVKNARTPGTVEVPIDRLAQVACSVCGAKLGYLDSGEIVTCTMSFCPIRAAKEAE